jgi:hypothetical protein
MRQYYSNITPVFPDPVLYTPDFSYMDKMLQRKEQQYNSGFTKLANQWAHISRPVTNPENAKVRDAFLKQAKENLKNLSTLDLSEYQNVESAMNVFAPYQNNQDLIGDQELTEFFNEQESVAEGYRNTDGGKYFYEDNLNDVRLQREMFAQAKPTDWKTFYSNRRPYNPYHNTHEEYTKLMENFKPSSVTTINKNGFYITTITDKSWYKEDIQRYLDGMLSDKAKNQLAIEARVRLNSNPEGVKELYLQQSKERLPAIDKELDRIDIELIKAKTQEEKETLLKNKTYFTNLKKELSDNVSKIEKGNKNFIRQNLESFSKSVYINGIIDKIATANQHKDIDQKLDFNQAALTVYTQQQQNWRTRYSENAQTYRTKLQIESSERLAGLRGKKGEGSGDEIPAVNVSVPGTESDINQPMSAEEIAAKARQVNSTLQIKHSEIINHIKSSTNKNEITQKDFEEFLAKNQGNKLVQEYVQISHNKDAWENMDRRRRDEAKEYAISQIGKENYDKLSEWEKSSKVNQVKLVGQDQGGVNLSKKLGVNNDFGGNKLVYENNTWLLKDPNGKVLANKGKYYFDKQMGVSQYDRDMQTAKVLGNRTASVNMGFDGDAIKTMYNQYYNQYLKEKKDVVFNNTGTSYVKNTEGFKPRQANLASLAGLETDDITNIIAVPTPKGLNISFKVKESDNNKLDQTRFDIIKKNIELNSSGSGATVSEYNEKTKVITIRNAPRELPAFKEDDVYGVIDPSFHVQVSEITSWRGNVPGSHKTIPLSTVDAGGKNRIFEIRKVTGYSPDSDSYMLLNPLNKTNLYPNQIFRNIIVPYKSMAILLNRPSDELDQVLQLMAGEK